MKTFDRQLFFKLKLLLVKDKNLTREGAAQALCYVGASGHIWAAGAPPFPLPPSTLPAPGAVTWQWPGGDPIPDRYSGRTRIVSGPYKDRIRTVTGSYPDRTDWSDCR